MMTVPAPPVLPDIEFPLKTRSGDTTEAGRLARAANAALEGSPAPAPRAPLPFLVSLLLSAQGPFGLDVEIKSEERVVGTWSIEINPRCAGAAHVSQASANLYVCASARGDARATGAFLVVRQWSVQIANREQLEQLYEILSVAALERLDSLMGGLPNESGESRSCVLFLVDGRHEDKKLFSLDRLQIRILEDLEQDHAIAGVDLRVAHGRGTGTQPHAVFASTLPASLHSGDSGLNAQDGRAIGRSTQHSLIGEVFVRETLSPENMRWNRRASDRLVAMQRSADAVTATPSSASSTTNRKTEDGGAPSDPATSTC